MIFGSKGDRDAYYSSIPMLVCSKDHRILYKNKIAYLYKMPRLNSSAEMMIKSTFGVELERVGPGRYTVVSCVTGYENELSGIVVPLDEKYNLWLFPATLSADCPEEMLKRLGGFINRLKATRKSIGALTDYSPHTLKRELIRRKSLSLSLEARVPDSFGEMNVENLVYTVESFMSRMLSRHGRIAVYRFGELPLGEYVRHPEAFVCALAYVIDMLTCEVGDKKPRLTFFKRGDWAVFELRVASKAEKSGDLELEDLCPQYALESVIFKELVRIYGWSFEMVRSPGRDAQLLVRMSTKTNKTSSYLSVEGYTESASCAFVRFMDFLRG